MQIVINIVILAGILITVITAIPVLRQLRHHPKGLFVLFFAEMWERFSYYGMRALLIFYLTQHFLFSDEQASTQYASYTSLVYLLPLIGGLLADRYLGTRKAVVFGAILLVLGHGSLAVEGKPNIPTLTYDGVTYEFVRESGHAEAQKLRVGDTLYAVAADAGNLHIVGLPAGAPLPQVLERGSYSQGVIKANNWAEPLFFFSLSLIILGLASSRPIFPPSSANSMRTRIRGGIPALPSFITASIWGRSGRPYCAAFWGSLMAGAGGSGWRVSGCWPGLWCLCGASRCFRARASRRARKRSRRLCSVPSTAKT